MYANHQLCRQTVLLSNRRSPAIKAPTSLLLPLSLNATSPCHRTPMTVTRLCHESNIIRDWILTTDIELYGCFWIMLWKKITTAGH